MALPAVKPTTQPDTGFEEDFARALKPDHKQQHMRDTLRKLAEKEPEAFVRGIRTMMNE